jgi:hypothetical protein
LTPTADSIKDTDMDKERFSLRITAHHGERFFPTIDALLAHLTERGFAADLCYIMDTVEGDGDRSLLPEDEEKVLDQAFSMRMPVAVLIHLPSSAVGE